MGVPTDRTDSAAIVPTFSAMWGNSWKTDVILNIKIDQPSTSSCDEGSKRRRLDDGQDTHINRQHSTILLHAIILHANSGYFETRLDPNDSTSMRYHDVSEGGKVVMSIAVEKPEEADALQNVLRFCYTRRLCDASQDTCSVSMSCLFHMARLSDRLQIQGCLDAVMIELATRRFDDDDDDCRTWALVVYHDENLPSCFSESTHGYAIHRAAVAKLATCMATAWKGTRLTSIRVVPTSAAFEEDAYNTRVDMLDLLRLDEVEMSCQIVFTRRFSPCRRQDVWYLWSHLPFEALIHLLRRRDRLITARSENSVLAMVNIWVDAHSRHSSRSSLPCPDEDEMWSHHVQEVYDDLSRPIVATAEELRELTSSMQLGHLTRAFAFETLSKLHWLKLSDSDVSGISRFVTGRANERCILRKGLGFDKYQNRWLDLEPRTRWTDGPVEERWTWSITRDQLLDALESKTILQDDVVFCNGVRVRMSIDRSTNSGGMRLQLTASTWHSLTCPFISCRFSVGLRGNKNSWAWRKDSCLHTSKHAVVISRFGHELLGDGSHIDHWTPYLTGDVVRIECCIEVEV